MGPHDKGRYTTRQYIHIYRIVSIASTLNVTACAHT